MGPEIFGLPKTRPKFFWPQNGRETVGFWMLYQRLTQVAPKLGKLPGKEKWAGMAS